MKKFLLLGTILIATSAFAFGGGRSGRVHERYKTGVDAIGVHRQIDNNEQADIKFECDDSNAHPDEHGACVCNEGYVEDDGQCLEKCPTGITRDADNSCTVCENGNVYLSYNEGTECDTATPQNMGCTKNSDCTGEKCNAESGKCYCKITGF